MRKDPLGWRVADPLPKNSINPGAPELSRSLRFLCGPAGPKRDWVGENRAERKVGHPPIRKA